SGLDYFGARFNGNQLCRWSSPDPLLSSAHVVNPQSWNRYSYGSNNPILIKDETGLYVYAAGATENDKRQFEAAIKKVESARNSFKNGSAEYNQLNSALAAYGRKGVDN